MEILKKIQISEPVYGEWVTREYAFYKGHFYQDRPIKGRRILTAEVKIEKIDDFLYYKRNGWYYGKNIYCGTLTELREYHKKFQGWQSLEEIR